MTEAMNAFEQQLTRVATQVAGPVRPFDAMRVVRTAKAEPVSHWSALARWFGGGVTTPIVRGFTMFSAVKFVAAGIIVALFGGFLLAGILTTQQGDEMAPAAATQSPAPVTMEELLSGMVTEEVEPGVFRIDNDGVRDLARVSEDVVPFTAGDDLDIVAGQDGSVWIFTPDWFFRVAAEESERVAPPWLSFDDADIEIGPDGHVWLVVERADGTVDLVTFADDPEAALRWGDPTDPEFRDTGERQYLGVEIGSDGTVYSAWLDAPGFVPDYGKVNVATFVDRSWRPLPALTTETSVFGWDFEVGGLGGIWLGGESPYRLDGLDWSLVEAPFEPEQLDASPDGTVWIQASEFDGQACGLQLARFDGTEWQSWGPDDEVPDVGPVFFFGGCNRGVSATAPDGSIWLAASDFLVDRECSGIARFDGTEWLHYLGGVCVYGAAVTPDGAVWLQAGEVRDEEPTGDGDDLGLPAPDPDIGSIQTYVITPDAVTAAS